MNHAKTFRFFISSTFSDFKKERQALHERVFPAIDKYLQDKHSDYTFQAIDLRWGVSEEAQYDQKTLDLCLNEVRSCKHYLHPNFLIMVGNRYGWVPLPYAIEKDEFERVLKHTKKEKSGLLQEWYKADENHLMNNDSWAYTLRQREPEGIYAKYGEWEKVENELRSILQETAKKFFDKKTEIYKKYFRSATETEVVEGIFQYSDPTHTQKEMQIEQKNLAELDKEYVFGFIRDKVNINYEAKENKELKSFQESLTDALLDTNIIYAEEKENYLDHFSNKIVKKIKESIEKQVEEHRKIIPNINVQEIVEQKDFKNLKTKIFEGRESEIEKVKKYIDNKTSQPYIVHGISGIGKSAFMAKLTDVILDETKLEYPVYFRFIGATAASSNIRTLLESLIEQLSNKGVIEKPQKYKTEVNKFYEQINELLRSITKPVIIILDALDQLQSKDYLQWLPENLPENLKIIISVLDEGDRHYYDTLEQKFLGKYEEEYRKKYRLQLEKITDGNAECILNKLLKNVKRDLTFRQKKYVLKQISKSGNSPLYLKIAFEEVKTWKSFDDEKLSVGIDDIIKEFIDNLTTKFHHDKDGKLIHKVLGLIKASKDGLSEKEILDLLSRDEEILKPLEKFDNSLTLCIDGRNVRRFPTSVWVRLYEQLQPFLMTKLVDGQNLIKFFHRQIDEAVGRYVYEPKKTKLHRELADYFLTLQNEDKLWNKRYNNLHMLDELPYHLFKSNDSKRLKEILFDLEFVGSIYDSYKQEGFRELLEKASELNGISEDEIYPWESFYREKEHYILQTTEGEGKPHQILFQLTYEDGVNSPCHNIAKQLISRNKIYWEWFQKLNLDESFTREVLYRYNTKIDNIEINENFNCIVLDDYFIFYYDRVIYIFSSKLKFVKKLESEKSLNYFKTIIDDKKQYVFFENELLIISSDEYEIKENYVKKTFTKVPKNMICKAVFFKNEIYYLVAPYNSSFERMCYDYDVVIHDNSDDSIFNYEAMIIDKSEDIIKLLLITNDLKIQKIVNMNSVSKYVKIITSDGDNIYYCKDNIYYKFNKKSKNYMIDDNPPEDKVKYCSKKEILDDYEEDFYYDSEEFYLSLNQEETYDLGEESYGEWLTYNDPSRHIISKTIKSASGEDCQKAELVNYSSYTYKLKDKKYLSIFGQYIFIIDLENRKINKEQFFIEQHMNQYFKKDEDSEIYIINEQSCILEKEKKLQIFFDNTVIYDCDKKIHSFYVYENILVILLEDKKVILYIDISHIHNLKIQTINLKKLQGIERQEKDKINRIIVTTLGKIVIEYSRYVEDIEEDWHQISEDEYEPYHRDHSHWEKRICFIEKINDDYKVTQDIYFAYIEESGEVDDYLFAIDDSKENYLIYSVHADSEEGYSFRLYDKSIPAREEKSTKFNFEWNTFYSKKRLITSGKYNNLKVYDQCPFLSVDIEEYYVKFVDENHNSIYYMGDLNELKFFNGKILTYDGSNIDLLQLKD